MAIVWTIRGEAGKAIDATERTLPALQAQDAVVEFWSAAPDTMKWTVWLGSISEAPGLVPDYTQRITLYRNGARYFTGWVTNVEPNIDGGRLGFDITVEGPWWWLAKEPLSSILADQTAETKERCAFVFATGSVTSHLQGLTTRAIAVGMPISAGSIATCFNVPRLSLRLQSFASAFADLMRWVPDGILYFDYSGSDATFPALCMQRRGASATVTITPSAGHFPKIKLKPRLELKLDEVKVASAVRVTKDNARVTQWALQTATVPGTVTNRQIVTVSGPELDTILPQDWTDAVVVRSEPISAFGILMSKEDRLRSAGGVALSIGPYDDGIFATQDFPTQITDADGNALPAGYNYYLASGETKDWWAKDGIEWISARVTAMIHTAITEELPLPTSPYTVTPPAWYQAIGGQMQGGYSVPDPARMRWVFYTTVSVPFIAVKTHWPTDKTLIRQEDYGFVNPPPDLADNLLAAQNWLPYEGSIPQTIDPATIPAGHVLGKKMDVMELLPAYESMGALIKGQSVTLRTGDVTYHVGAPARLAYKDLAERFRANGADNVVWINEINPVSPPSGPGAPSSHRTLTEGGDVEVGEDGSTAVDEDDT